MQLRWTEEAANDLEHIADYLFEHASERCGGIGALDLRRARRAADISVSGTPGRKQGTRELVLSPLPYIVVYAVRGDVIYIARILHGAQQWS